MLTVPPENSTSTSSWVFEYVPVTYVIASV